MSIEREYDRMKKSNSLPTDSLEYLRTDSLTLHQCYSLPPSPGNSLTTASQTGLLSRLKRRFSKKLWKKHHSRRASDESSVDFDFERDRSSSAGSLSAADIEVHTQQGSLLNAIRFYLNEPSRTSF